MIDKLTCEDFAPHVDETFQIEIESGNVLDMHLIEATELGGTVADRTPFSLIFRTAEEEPLAQRIYKVRHRKLGTMDLFLVPIGPDNEGMRYEAVFT